MKTIGIIGGMSWESTHYYYRCMNEYVFAKLGGFNSIEAVIYSVNFAPIEELVKRGDWDSVAKIVATLAKKIEAAGAELLIMTANTIHKIADHVQASIGIPLLHIVDPTAKAIQQAHLKKVGLIGTQITMEDSFYKGRLKQIHGIDVIIPESQDRKVIQEIIFGELVIGKVNNSSREKLLEIIQKLPTEAVILGCTELNLLVHQKNTSVQLFDTTELHAKAAVDTALKS